MPFEAGGGVFFQFPLGDFANWADFVEPFIAKPAGGTAVARIVDEKCFVAMGGDAGLFPDFFNGFDAM